MTNTEHTPNPWTAESYSPIVTGSGAKKLADSAVAPLVAAARGYSTFVDKAGAKLVASRSNGATSQLSLTRKLAQLVANDEDVLVIPWYRAAAVADDGIAVKSRTTQLRPSNPRANEKGKLVKYEFLAGEQTTLDFNPGTPIEYITTSPTVLMTEGAIKGDSALTAQLRSAGATDEQLALPADLSTARAELEKLMLTVPVKDRVAIMSFAGVANWRDQADWRAVKLTDRKVYVAFDGDTDTNYNVYKQAKDLFAFIGEVKHGTPGLLNLGSVEAETAKLAAGVAPEEKLGLDDYLAKVGNWAGALSLVQPNLPPEPARRESESFSVGTWRVNPTKEHIVEAFEQQTSFDGGPAEPQWLQKYSIGGRLMRTEQLRRPAQQEVDSGRLDPELETEMSDTRVVIELFWEDVATGLPRSGVITGPSTLLGKLPADWPRDGANIPLDLIRHPEWPPTKVDWLKAIKGHRPADTVQMSAWSTMGWVPVEGGHPAFIVGNQVLGASPADEQRTQPGVTEKVLSGATAFGVMDDYWDVEASEWKTQTARDLRLVLDTYIESGAWKEQSAAITAVACMYRPTMPAHCPVTLYIYGPPRAGKTYTAAHIMGAWQCKLGTWSVHNLPGSAGDTFASTEFSIARTPIWPADDLAPSPDPREAAKQEAEIGKIIRSVFNGSGRRKMEGASGAQRATEEPSALFIVTAENEPSTASVRERVVAIETPKGMFSNETATAAVEALNLIDGAPARLTAAMVRFWTFEGTEFGDTWAEKTASLKERIREIARFGATLLEEDFGMGAGEATRHANLAAQLAVTFEVLAALAEYVGIDESDPIMERLGRTKGGYSYQLFAKAAGTIKRQRESTPGRTLVEMCATLMNAGNAHVENPNAPGNPPVEADPANGENAAAIAAQLNRALGWVPDASGRPVPKGVSIGYYGRVPSTKQEVVLFNAVNAFNTAKRFHSDRILPGSNQTVAWASVWGEGLCADRTRREGVSTVQGKLTGNTDDATGRILAGVPVLFDAVLDPEFAANAAAAAAAE